MCDYPIVEAHHSLTYRQQLLGNELQSVLADLPPLQSMFSTAGYL